MSCYKPLIRLYNPENKDISGRVYSLARFSEISGKQLKYEDLMYRKDVMLIPCGQCIGCRIRQREDWTTRIELEARDYPREQVWFITLTYDDNHVPGMIVNTGEIIRKAQYVWTLSGRFSPGFQTYCTFRMISPVFTIMPGTWSSSYVSVINQTSSLG